MINVSFSKLSNNSLFTFSEMVYELISPTPVTELGIELYFKEYVPKYEKYKKAMLKAKKVMKILGNKDQKRDKDGLNFRRHVKNYTNHPNPEIAAQAKLLLTEIDSHGKDFYKKKYEEQTAVLKYIFKIVDEKFADFILTIHADDWYNILKESQKDFEETRIELTKSNAEFLNEESPSHIRPDLIEVMRNLFAFLPLHFRVTKNEQLGKIIDQLITEAKRY